MKMKTISRTNFINQIEAAREQLDETTYDHLEKNTIRFAPNTTKRQNAINAVRITEVEMIPYLDDDKLGVKGVASGTGQSYEPQILFLDCVFEDEPIGQAVTFTGADGEEYHVQPISLSRQDVQVRCTCLDFYWRFAIYNQKDGSLLGQGPGLYQKKTDRAPNNPEQIPGMCKHLLKLGVELRSTGIIVP